MKIRILIFCLTILSLPMQAIAATLSFNTGSGNVDEGNSIAVDIVVGDLGSFTADSLSAFAFDVSYDASILGFSSVSYGALLGDPNNFSDTDIVTTPSSGVLNLFEFSFLLDTELDALQPSSFTLATVVFNGLLAGNSALSFGGADLSDALGFSLATTTTSGDITVNSVNTTPPTNAVDEPPVLFLVLISLFGLTYLRRKNHTSFIA